MKLCLKRPILLILLIGAATCLSILSCVTTELPKSTKSPERHANRIPHTIVLTGKAQVYGWFKGESIIASVTLRHKDRKIESELSEQTARTQPLQYNPFPTRGGTAWVNSRLYSYEFETEPFSLDELTPRTKVTPIPIRKVMAGTLIRRNRKTQATSTVLKDVKMILQQIVHTSDQSGNAVVFGNSAELFALIESHPTDSAIVSIRLDDPTIDGQTSDSIFNGVRATTELPLDRNSVWNLHLPQPRPLRVHIIERLY